MTGSDDLVVDTNSRLGNSANDQPPAEDSVVALEEALEAARLRLRQRLTDEIDQLRAESERLNKHRDQLRREALSIEEQAKETAARIVAEARQTEAQMRAEANRMVDEVQTRLHDGVSGFLQQAVEEIATIRRTIVVAHSESAPAADHPPPTRPVEGNEEGVVTRLTVRPALAADARADLKDRLEQLPGVYAVIVGVIADQSCEMLIAHEPSAPVRDSILALAPGEIHLTAGGAGYVEVELARVDWLRPS